jgi:AhpD family alkylhydroperoxidase
MSDHYHDPGDVRLLKEMRTLAPADFDGWRALNSIVGRTDGTIPRKYRELIAIAVSVTTQCPYCIEAHAKAAKAAGATREEIAEASFVAAAVRGGGAALHGTMGVEFLDQS